MVDVVKLRGAAGARAVSHCGELWVDVGGLLHGTAAGAHSSVPIFRCPFFPAAIFRCLNYRCRFFPDINFVLPVFYLPPHFSLPSFPAAQFSIANFSCCRFFPVPFSAAVIIF